MPRALEVISGFVTAPSTTQTALTLATGDSLTVRQAKEGSPIYLLQVWTDQQSAGTVRIRSPRMHDNVQGLRIRSVASEVKPLLPMGFKQPLFGGDVLNVDLSGSATGGDIESVCLLIYYEDLPGSNARLITYDEFMKRGANLSVVENTIALGTAGGWSGSEAVNAENDNFKANTDYALIGYHVDTECAAVAWRGSDTSNFRVGGPGDELGKQITGDWFLRLAKATGLPVIPVFNSNNKGGISIDGVQDENGADPLVSQHFVELSKS